MEKKKVNKIGEKELKIISLHKGTIQEMELIYPDPIKTMGTALKLAGMLIPTGGLPKKFIKSYNINCQTPFVQDAKFAGILGANNVHVVDIGGYSISNGDGKINIELYGIQNNSLVLNFKLRDIVPYTSSVHFQLKVANRFTKIVEVNTFYRDVLLEFVLPSFSNGVYIELTTLESKAAWTFLECKVDLFEDLFAKVRP